MVRAGYHRGHFLLKITKYPAVTFILSFTMATNFWYFLTVLFFLFDFGAMTTSGTLQPKAPNFQYFEKPMYRYPYYDSKGRGKLLYGYGGTDLYQYKSYSPLEGIH